MVDFNSYEGEIDYKANGYKPIGIRETDELGNVKVFSPRSNHFCKDCVLYYKRLHLAGKTEKEFPLVCSYDRRLSRSSVTRDMFATEDEFNLAYASIDPVTWGKVFLDFDARWYQEEASNCSSQFRVMRWGRRSGKSEIIALLCLWMTFTKKNYHVLVICPYESQVELLFNKIRALIERNQEVSESAKIKQSPPQKISFNNGSTIIGFSAGAKSSARSDKIRGQGANCIVFDEADYIEDGDIETVMAVLADQPDTNVIFSSTPTGARRAFFQNCTNKNGRYKEFHFISSESPSWRDVSEFELKFKYSEGGYNREFNAEFGAELEGVFRASDVDSTLRKYSFVDSNPAAYEGHDIAMGVDWNKITGTHLVVVARDPKSKVVKTVDKKIIRKQDFTQHAGVEAVRQMDEKWKCDWIFVDSGYGGVQVEMLHKMDEWKGTTFKRRLEAIELGGTTEILSPATGLPEKKPTKGLMVNLCVKLVERHLLEIPESEDTTQQIIESEIPYLDIGIVQQMRNYKVEKISPTGHITYSDDYEHTLTALMLAVFAIGLKCEDYQRHSYDNTMATVGAIGKALNIPTHDMNGNPLAPSTVALLRESAVRAQKEEEAEFQKKLADLRINTGRPKIGDGAKVANKDGEILVAKNGVPMRESTHTFGPRRFRDASSTRGRSFRKRNDRSH